MSRVRPIPVAVSVLITEVLLTLIGTEVSYQTVIHSRTGALQILGESVGIPWRAPWRRGFSFDGPKLTITVLVFLVVLTVLTWLIARGVRGDRSFLTVFFGVWGVVAGAQVVSGLLRIELLYGTAYGAGANARGLFVLGQGAVVQHAAYFGWIPALVAALIALLTRASDTAGGQFGGPVGAS